MKKLFVPYLEALNSLPLSSAATVMETEAQREYINIINWSAFPYMPITVFDIARSSDSLFLRYFVRGNSLKALQTSDNSPVYTDSCVEFFMRKEGEWDYMNFEFNCIGVCDAARRQSREIKESLNDEEYKSIQRYSSLESKVPFEEKEGLFSWELIVTIPFTLMGLDPNNLPQKISANFYKCADKTANPHYVSWNPISTLNPDFHRPEFFGKLYF